MIDNVLPNPTSFLPGLLDGESTITSTGAPPLAPTDQLLPISRSPLGVKGYLPTAVGVSLACRSRSLNLRRSAELLIAPSGPVMNLLKASWI
jgi:hypothetical protein